MAGYPLMSLIFTYATLGAVAYGADRRWGIATRGWFIDLTLPEPIEHKEGFLVERPFGAQLTGAAFLVTVIAAARLAAGAGAWFTEVPVALMGAVAVLGGIRAAGLAVTLRGRGTAWMEARRAAAQVPEAPEVPEVAPDPQPPRAELEAAKMARMDELLGRTA